MSYYTTLNLLLSIQNQTLYDLTKILFFFFQYCKYYLVNFCPHDLFVNTRADLGPCAKVHDDEVKRLYDESNSHKKFQYLDDFIRFCNNILNDVQRKIEKGKQRLALMNNAVSIDKFIYVK